MLLDNVRRFIIGTVLLAHPTFSCGPKPGSPPLDISSLITANNAARPSGIVPHKKIALDNVRVFDGTCILPLSTVVIDGPLIGSDPTGAEHIDGEGGVLLPGLIDAHCHPTNITHMQELAKWGVTTGFVMACFAQELCTSLANHTGLPSLLRSSTPAASPNSTHGRITAAVMNSSALLVNSTADVPAWINRQLAGQNPDFFKFIAEAPNGIEQATLNALVQESRHYGKQSVIHASAFDAYTQAVLSGTTHIHHAPIDKQATEDLITKMLQQYQISTPTLTMMRATSQAVNYTGGHNFTAALATAAMAHKAGVPVLAGTDANTQQGVPAMVPFGRSLHDELENLIEAGMSNVEALLAATVKPARAFGLWDRGTIQPGMRADLLLVGGDPLLNINATRNIKRVWIGGVQSNLTI